MKLSELAEKTGARVEGDANIEIESAVGLDQAGPGQITFLSNARYTPRVKTTRASAIFVDQDTDIGRNDIAVLRAKDPYLAFTRAMILFHPPASFKAAIHPSAVIDASARIAGSALIGAHVVIGSHAEIGERVQIRSNVSIGDNVIVGA